MSSEATFLVFMQQKKGSLASCTGCWIYKKQFTDTENLTDRVIFGFKKFLDLYYAALNQIITTFSVRFACGRVYEKEDIYVRLKHVEIK